jgi:predicted small secreted protein
VRRALCVLMLACAVTMTACTSPETRRTRGGDAGADVGNRPAGTGVSMHGGSDPFWKTPDRLGGLKAMPLDPARQAQHLSR